MNSTVLKENLTFFKENKTSTKYFKEELRPFG
jgi:hypothetical protein